MKTSEKLKPIYCYEGVELVAVILPVRIER